MGSGRQVVNLKDLSIPQLEALRENIETQLEMAAKKFQNSLNSIEYLTKLKTPSQTALVPLTQSLYLDGKIELPTKFIIDIGTGYFVEKNVKESKDYFKRKMDYVNRQIEKFKPSLNDKISLKRGIEDVMKGKIAALLKAQQEKMASGDAEKDNSSKSADLGTTSKQSSSVINDKSVNNK